MNHALQAILPEGRHEPEHDADGPFVWTRRLFSVQAPATDATLCRLTLANPLPGNTLSCASASGRQEIIALAEGLQTCDLPLQGGRAELRLGRSFAPGGADARELGVQVRDVDFPAGPKHVLHREGFHQQEPGELRPFRWMAGTARCEVLGAGPDDWLIFELGHSGEAPVVFRIAGRKAVEVFVISGWQQLAFPLAELDSPDGSYVLSCEHRQSGPGDARELSVMLGRIKVGAPSPYELNSAKFYRNLFRSTVVDSYPTFLTFETSSRCNMQCSMCIVDRDLKYIEKRPQRSFANIRDMYLRLVPYASKLQLHATGEVFMDDSFWEALDLARPHAQDHVLEIEIFTNGQLLTQDTISRLLDSPLTDICISVDAATKRTYERLRGEGFENLLRNIENLAARAAGSRLRITMSMALMRENLPELPGMVRLAGSLGVKTVSYWPLLAIGLNMPIKTKPDGFVFFYKQQMLMYYPHLTAATVAEAHRVAGETGVRIATTPCFRKDYSLFTHADVDYPLSVAEFDAFVQSDGYFSTIHQAVDEQSFKYCYYPWHIAFVTASGSFAPCLLLMYKGGVRSTDDGFDAAWNGPEMQRLRQGIMDNKVHPLCKNAQCRFINMMS